MTKLLVIMAHPHTETTGKSVQVAQTFITQYQQNHPEDEIVVRDLFTTSVPPLNDETFDAWLKVKYGKTLNSDEETLLAAHSDWLEEFVSADKYVFVNPMYNHFLPAELKSYIDVTAVTRKTFKYTANGPVGLLTGKKALHIQAAGGLYHDPEHPNAQADLGDSYLDMILNLYGIKDTNKIFIEGCDQMPEQTATILAAANDEATQLAKTF
ncbi:FMN-dependent NADH-azoreductase [Secundilactobacillus paracollinoides]|uniref:FMN-dependent NADH-azoreductase n=1 Tax=Secundilactobacillus paracollinoides TaxID=240427 RepID=UPI0006D12F54|nr:FMN-dependent NADH-azoreductase [Secundilactobacillus paracollinoides]KRL81523.1 FMN-dependent NADH-azoreductase 2 [Secundilactobacillus paracollinoides DSM 15502 = JCM 11969]